MFLLVVYSALESVTVFTGCPVSQEDNVAKLLCTKKPVSSFSTVASPSPPLSLCTRLPGLPVSINNTEGERETEGERANRKTDSTRENTKRKTDTVRVRLRVRQTGNESA